MDNLWKHNTHLADRRFTRQRFQEVQGDGGWLTSRLLVSHKVYSQCYERDKWLLKTIEFACTKSAGLSVRMMPTHACFNWRFFLHGSCVATIHVHISKCTSIRRPTRLVNALKSPIKYLLLERSKFLFSMKFFNSEDAQRTLSFIA
jgi:hypothetical protein